MRDSFGILYTSYLLCIVKIKKEREKKIRKRERKERVIEKEIDRYREKNNKRTKVVHNNVSQGCNDGVFCEM